MPHYDQNWEDLGKSIQDAVDRAINSRDYQKLNQTVRQTIDRAVDAGGEAVRKAMSGSARKNETRYQAPARPVVPARKVSALYGSTTGKMVGGILKITSGSMLSPFAFLVLLGGLSSSVLTAADLAVICMMGVMLGAGVWLICSGIGNLGMVKRFDIYRRVLGQKTQCALDRLARSVGKSEKFVRRELWKMIGKGLFREGHMDREETCLITSDETYQYFEQSRLQLEERQRQEAASVQKAAAPRDPQVQEVLERGNAFIAQIRRCNDAIPGEEISAKISHMEMIVRRIFERAEAHPEIVPDLKKLMDYYLPMTVKLLNAYADMDAQPVQGENIQSSKREIEDTLDTLNRAFEKLLDSVFADTAMDVSSDISVLNTLLAQEGLTEDDLSKMKQQKNL